MVLCSPPGDLGIYASENIVKPKSKKVPKKEKKEGFGLRAYTKIK